MNNQAHYDISNCDAVNSAPPYFTEKAARIHLW